MVGFNKVLEHTFTKVYDVTHDDRYESIPVILLSYRKKSKRLMQSASFKLVSSKEVAMPMEFLVPSIFVVLPTQITEENVLKKRLDEMMELEEEIVLVGLH